MCKIEEELVQCSTTRAPHQKKVSTYIAILETPPHISHAGELAVHSRDLPQNTKQSLA